jgi:hypothetical protein
MLWAIILATTAWLILWACITLGAISDANQPNPFAQRSGGIASGARTSCRSSLSAARTANAFGNSRIQSLTSGGGKARASRCFSWPVRSLRGVLHSR